MGVIVIGSGPAGVAAAEALLAQGRHVTMLDVGERLEPDRADLKTRLAKTEPERWSASDVAALTGGRRTERAGGIWPFGSDFLFRDPTRLFVNDDPPARIGLRPSFAAGGLSNGWGASVLPYRDEDLADWPQDARALAPHYAALESFMPVAARPVSSQRFDGWQSIDGVRRPLR